MVSINCAALPETLLESEMFGHRKGAFTDAQREKPGLLEVAHGGTMFLDEVTEMSPAIQAKLLRVIQDGVIRRVGSEDVDAVGLSILSGAHMELCPKVVQLMREKGMSDVPVFAGGIIPDEDIEPLRLAGVQGVFGPGTPTIQIVDFVRSLAPEKA